MPTFKSNVPPECPAAGDETYYQTIHDRIAANPPSWKDWIGFIGMLLTLVTVVVQGGRMLERLDSATDQIKSVAAIVGKLNDDLSVVRVELAKQHGIDLVHEEQIKSIDGRLAGIERRTGR